MLRIRKEDIDLQKMEKIIEYFGSQTKLADRLKLTKQNINSWCNGRGNIPLHHLQRIEKMSNGKFKVRFLLKKERNGKTENH